MSERLRTKAEALRDRVATYARGARRATLAGVADACIILDACPCVAWSSTVTLASLALAAHQRYGGRLVVWTCSASVGALEALPRGTVAVVDESLQRRLRQPEALVGCGVELVYRKLHTKGFVLGIRRSASGDQRYDECAPLVCLSSCNISRGCGLEHFDVAQDAGLAAAALAALSLDTDPCAVS